MKLTADTITDEQIRALKLELARQLSTEDDIPYATWKVWEQDFLACEAALGRIRKRFQRPGYKREGRARCAEILNTRSAK